MTQPPDARAQWLEGGLPLAALKMLYELWERESREWRLACAPGCPLCCSDRLALTTLEGRGLAQALERAGRSDLLARAAAPNAAPPPRPAATFNALAAACLSQEEPPEEEPFAGELGACPLLENGLCAVYEARPLACRAMVSQEKCREGGNALADPWWLTLATALHQIVEHMDQGGGYGLLPPVLASLSGASAQGLLACRDLPGIPAPPEHQQRLQDVLETLFRQPLDGKSLGWWLRAIQIA